MRWQALLFDLDGTLVDTAPDLAGAVQDLARERDLPIPAFADLRPVASHGAPGLLGTGFGIAVDDPRYSALRLDFLRLYRARAHRDSILFPGIAEILEQLRSRRLPWAVVTNKSAELAQEVLDRLALPYPPAVVVGGDTTAKAKPSPVPVRYALDRLGIDHPHALFLGDDRRDVEAAHAAGIPAWAAAWGYWQQSDPPIQWGAEAIINDSEHLLSCLLTD
ncbi:MAG: HAD-IA family hydrolase [Candidatus Igneacidithiobacillus chanchocoensis]